MLFQTHHNCYNHILIILEKFDKPYDNKKLYMKTIVSSKNCDKCFNDDKWDNSKYTFYEGM